MHLMPQNCHFRSQHWNCYKAVNELFAKVTDARASDHDRVWIQDFHLALVPAALRQRRPSLPIGLFWHVPFPPESFFRIFPWRRELLEGMLGSDLIGFHTTSYADHFVECCARICGLEVDRAQRLSQLPRPNGQGAGLSSRYPGGLFCRIGRQPTGSGTRAPDKKRDEFSDSNPGR